MSEIVRTTVEENDANIVKSQVMNVLDDNLIRHQVRGLEGPAPEPPVLETLNVTENGTYTPEEGVDGFDVVNVDVEFPGDDAYDLKSATPGAIVSITDGEPLPLNELKISVEPVQAGSGDPSPTNVRAISGWTECNVTRCGKNLLNPNNYIIGTNSQYNISEGNTLSQGGDSNRATSNGKNPISVNVATEWAGITYISDTIKSNQKYQLSFSETAPLPSNFRMSIYFVDDNYKVLYKHSNYTTPTNINTYLIPTTDCRVAVFIGSSAVQTISVSNLQLEIGSTATTYEAYKGNTYNIQFKDSQGNPITVYGATVDAVNGVLTVTDGYIASYNGETLPSTWISSIDVYEEGTTPTNGAEVVYKLATPITYQLDPTSIRLLQGINNIFADTGDILKCEYFYKIAVVGDDLISQIKVVDVEGTPTIKDVKRDFALTGNNAISITNGNIDFGSDNNCYLNCQVSQMNLIPYVIEADIVTCGFETDTESNKMRGIFTFGQNKSTLWGLFFNTEATGEAGKGTLTFRPQLNVSTDSEPIAPSDLEGKTLKLYCNCGLDSDNNIIYDKNNALIFLGDDLLINGDFSNYAGEKWGEMCSMGWSSYNWGCPGLIISEYRVKELSTLLGGN